MLFDRNACCNNPAADRSNRLQHGAWNRAGMLEAAPGISSTNNEQQQQCSLATAVVTCLELPSASVSTCLIRFLDFIL